MDATPHSRAPAAMVVAFISVSILLLASLPFIECKHSSTLLSLGENLQELDDNVSESIEDHLDSDGASLEGEELAGLTRSQKVDLLTTRLSEIYRQLRLRAAPAPAAATPTPTPGASLSSQAICLGCRAAMRLLFSPLIPIELLLAAFENVCAGLRLMSARACAGYAAIFHDDLEYIRKNTPLSQDEVCGLLVGVHCARSKTENLFWTINIPERVANTTTTAKRRKPSRRESEHSGGGGDAGEQQVKASSFVQVTDIHLDPDYEPGSLSVCNEVHCCRATSGLRPRDERLRAGKWGSYNYCDVPVRTVEETLRRISSEHPEAKYWIWTGDLLPHDAWNSTRRSASHHIRSVTKLVKRYSKNTHVYPVVGNHEAVPIHSFAPPQIRGNLSTAWLYELLADEWADWLPDRALETFRFGGYYSVPVHDGLRIVVINTNYCSRLNPWTVYDPIDPANQLKWLVEELTKAEANAEKVHLMSHIPADNRECTQAWLWNFIKIIDRFRDTILAQYYAHTHRDEFRVIYSLDKGREEEPVGVEFVGPSVTTYISVNPSYRVYHQNERGYILDAETYYFNLTQANELPPEGKPEWKLAHSFKTDLNTTGVIEPLDWHNYLVKLSGDDELFYKFQNNFFRFSDVKLKKRCEGRCRRQMVGDMRLYHPYETEPRPFKLY